MRIVGNRFSFFGMVLWFAPLGLAAQTSPVEAVRAYRVAHGPAILKGFAELLSIPNVARDSVGINRNAVYIRDALRELGVQSELLRLPGAPPIVYGELDVPGATRTLGIYVHYDGQPVDSSRWTNAPWAPTLYTRAIEDGGTRRDFPGDGESIDPEWRIYARSAGDDKAPIGALLPVLRAFREAGISPTSNIRFFFDGEEEAGSPRLRQYLETNRDRLDGIDVWLFFDGPVHQSRRPLLTFGVRGVTGMQVTIYGSIRPLHSGHYGNWAPVPGQMLAELLASMKDRDGNVLVEGFYDTVEPLGELERAALAALPDYDDELKRELGLFRTEGSGASLAERLLLPSLTVRGLASANVGALARNIIPATATAALGIRLVKANDPEHMKDLVEAHIRRQGYHIVREDPNREIRLRYPRIAKVTRSGGYAAARTPMNLPIVRQVVRAMRRVAGDDLVVIPTLGGSLPLYLFTDVMAKPALILPIANHDDNQHAADENLRIANLWYGIDLYAALLTMPVDDGAIEPPSSGPRR
ncbi:MAG: M20/M25/M40 family metallo-hydrolase [Gemmatimonadetes bacterium]|nr:M20/M25/M40 family metallo-hydrolase [Gemmatimonadota bacterium]